MDQISKFQKQLYQNFGIPVSKFQKSWIKYQNFKSVDQNFRGLDHGSKFQKRLDHGSEFTPSRALILFTRVNFLFNFFSRFIHIKCPPPGHIFIINKFSHKLADGIRTSFNPPCLTRVIIDFYRLSSCRTCECY